MITRSLQLSCIVAAVAFAYPFSEREPAALHLEKMDRLDSVQPKSDEQITLAAAVPQALAKLETDQPVAEDHPAAAEDHPAGTEDHPAGAEDHPASADAHPADAENHPADAVPPKLDLSY